MKTIIEITIPGYENATVEENETSYFIDLKTGLGEAEYPKGSFSLEDAINDQTNIGSEY